MNDRESKLIEATDTIVSQAEFLERHIQSQLTMIHHKETAIRWSVWLNFALTVILLLNFLTDLNTSCS